MDKKLLTFSTHLMNELGLPEEHGISLIFGRFFDLGGVKGLCLLLLH